jgi:glutamate racemase
MQIVYKLLVFTLVASSLLAQKPIDERMLNDKNSFYYLDFGKYPKADRSLPVGVFDSGTGGLTVLNAIVTFDEYDNKTGQKNPDGKPDFSTEDFIYLADQANMPYGHYSSLGKTDLLREHILKDAQFLLSNKYYQANGEMKADKKPIKTLVIACNTATAYGKEYIEEMLQKAQSNLKVIGVIDAGARGALATFDKTENGSIAVFATAGTVASGGYVRAIERLKKELNYTGNLQVFSQGGTGLAEALDGEYNYIDKKATAPRQDYKGPNINNNSLAIDRTLMDIYGFEFAEGQMLCDAKNVDDCSQLQINSAPNYARYHLVSLLENIRKTPNALPLKTMILGCTHYPYMKDVINKVLTELRNYQKDGQYRYRHLLTENVILIDPSINTARELYEHLYQQKLGNPNGSLNNAEFYISVPNLQLPQIQTEANGTRFTYDYKYGRVAGQDLQYIMNQPFSKQNISQDVAERLSQQIPTVYRLIQHFDANSDKTKSLRTEDKL